MTTDEQTSILPPDTYVLSDSVVESTSSGQATVVGSLLEDHNYSAFPRYAHVSDSFGVPQIYCRSLLSSGNGFPPSNITGDFYRPDFHYTLGACLGDVGYVDEYGAFVFCFNIFCPRDDEIQAIDLPPDFVQFKPPLSSESIDFSLEHHLPGTVLTSEGITVSRISESPLRVKFSSSKREGAVLILPKGASREDLIDPFQLFPYIKSNAARWYQLCNRTGSEKGAAHAVPNGTLHLVTGVDRASSWATATFPYRRRGSYPLSFEWDDASNPTWKGASGMTTIYRHYKDAAVEGSLGAVFIRFLSIAVKPMRKLGRLGNIPRFVLPASQEPLPPSILGRIRTPKMFDKFKKPTKKITPCPPGELIFNPSFILLQVLQKMEPTAEASIILDSVWRSDLTKEQLCHFELVELMHRIIKHNRIVNVDGIAMLTSRPEEKTVPPPLPFWQTFIPCVLSVEGETIEDPEERATLKRLHTII